MSTATAFQVWMDAGMACLKRAPAPNVKRAPARDPIPLRREAAQYTPAHLRTDNCKGCERMDYQVRNPDTPYERKAMRCRLHGFSVSHGATCDDWKRKP